jgi:hypothetical protein
MKTPATNIYSVIDNELSRMHKLLHWYLQLPRGTATTNQSTYQSTSELYKRIVAMQDVTLKMASEVDPAIQEKIAELALLGDGKNETIPA